MIELKNITRRVGKTDRVLLDDVNLSIQAGQRIGLIGPSGCGKSTLLRVIARLDPCQQGQVWFHGRTIDGDEVPPYRRRVVYLPQRPAFIDGTVRENLELPFRLGVSQTDFDAARTMHWFDELSKPPDFLDQPARVLSGGEQQIVSLVRAISLDPQVLLLDEPTTSLDADSTVRFEQLALRWTESMKTDSTWVWASHDADQVRRMTSRIVTMDRGRLTGGDDRV